jgi:hypothetical protein
MVKRWLRRSVRLVGLVAGGSLLAFSLSSCVVLPVTVNSVTGTYEPYNPMFGDEGIPAEEVDFTVGGSPSGDLICLIEVFNNSGQMVGSTVMGTGPQTGNSASVEESVPVDITGNIFNGSASNAIVRCGTKG